jgi:hypothetical protein
VCFIFWPKIRHSARKKKKNGYEDAKAKISEKSRKFASFRGIFSGTRQF